MTYEGNTIIIVPTQPSMVWGLAIDAYPVDKVTITVTTRNIDVKAKGSVLWYSDAKGTVSMNTPTGIKAEIVNSGSYAGNKATRTVKLIGTGESVTVDPPYYFRVMFDSIKSHNVGELYFYTAPR